MPKAQDTSGAARTDQSLVAAPGAGKCIVVRSISVSSLAANVVTLESSTTNLKYRIDIPATTAYQFRGEGLPGNELFRCNANESLTVTTTAATTYFIQVDYDIRTTRGTSA